MGIQDDRRHRGRYPDDRFGFAFQRGTRGLFLRSGCPHRRAAMEDVPRCSSHFRSDDILGGGQAVRGSQRRELPIHFRAAAVVWTWKKEISDEYSCYCPHPDDESIGCGRTPTSLGLSVCWLADSVSIARPTASTEIESLTTHFLASLFPNVSNR